MSVDIDQILSASSTRCSAITVFFIKGVLHFVLNSNLFSFGDSLYRQTKGVAIGSPIVLSLICEHLLPGLSCHFLHMRKLSQHLGQGAQPKYPLRASFFAHFARKACVKNKV